ncbi:MULTISPECIES: WXG100 family type VII secretion target [unclassified Streptomyces]|uniref:WXG100 family type VII secretion target n=1 Tax=unclassified Streptomyces TaxID=2593676 RepID=UPI0033FE61CD
MSQHPNDRMVVTYHSLDQAAAAIDKQAGDLNTALEALQTKLKGISDDFEGEAKTAADGAHKKWDTEAKSIHESLKGIARAVRDAAPAYQAGDHKARSYYDF